MKSLLKVCIIAAILICAAQAQDPSKPQLRKGVSVQMAVANHAAETRAADAEHAIVLAITADGRLFNGIEPTEPGALSSLAAPTIYVKADSRAPFQKVLTILDALRGKSVVLLTASPTSADRSKPIPPYGITLTVSK